MKKINIFYWIITALFCLMTAVGGVFDLISHPDALKVFAHLGYPDYLSPFIGLAKLLGVVALLVPGFPRIREWAYAGFFFDFIGAMYSHIRSGDPVSQWAPILIGLVLMFVSYYLNRRRQEAKTVNPS